MSKLEFGIFDSFGPFEMAEFPAVIAAQLPALVEEMQQS